MRTTSKILLTGAAAIGAVPTVAHAQDTVPPKVVMTTPGGVNIADGRFMYSETDISIGPLTLERFFQSPGPTTRPNDPYFGYSMTHNFDIYVAPNFIPAHPQPFPRPIRYQPIVHIGQSASGVYFQPSIGSSSVSPHNLDAQSGNLEMTGGVYDYIDQAGTIYIFNPTVSAAGKAGANSQRIASITFPDGRIQTFSYDASKRLKLVHDTSGYALVFDYNANNDVSAACGFNLAQTYVTASSTCTGAALKTSYGYSGNFLTSATDVTNQTTTYASDFSCITPPGYTSCKITNSIDVDGVVVGQVLAGASWGNLPAPLFLISNPEYSPSDCDMDASFTNPDSKTWSYSFTKSSPCGVTDPNGRTTSYQWTGAAQYDPWVTPYSEGTLLVSATMPEGNKYLAEYNGPRNAITKETWKAKPGSGLADRVKQYGYGSCASPGSYQSCTKPIWIRDPKSNQTDYTYATHGGMLTEMQPAPTAGAARPLKVNTYVQKYAYIKNSGGSLVPAAAPIWMPNTETVCQTVAGSSTPTCDAGAQQTVTTYEYGANGTANNLRVKGQVVSSGGVSLRTCFGYDNQGNKIWETTPRAGLGSCP